MTSGKRLILIPTYNEKENIASILSELLTLYSEVEIWVIDDNSPDGTAQIVEGIYLNHPRVKVIKRPKKSGLGDAYKDVLSKVQKMSDFSEILTMDADRSHDPKSVRHMFENLSRHDFVVGSRYVRGGRVSGWSKKRLALSWLGNLYTRMIMGFPVKDGTAGFVAFRRSIIEEIDFGSIASSGYMYQIEFKNTLLKKGAKHKEIPITFSERLLGQSKMSGKIIFEGLMMPWKILWKDKSMLLGRVGLMLTTLFFITTLAFSFYKLAESPSVWYDEGVYFQMAKNLAEKDINGFQVAPGDIEHVSKITVGYPLIYPLAFIFKIFGADVVVARSLMIIFLTGLVIFAYLFVKKTFSTPFAFATLALLVSFPPLYGNGKSVLGEVPGLFFLTATLFFLSKALSIVVYKDPIGDLPGRDRRIKTKLLIMAGLFAGLSVATKPIFILLLPALAIGDFLAWKRGQLSIKNIAVASVATVVPILIWLLTQFGRGDRAVEIIKFFINPQATEGLMATVLGNFKLLISDTSSLYLLATLLVWVVSIIFLILQRKKINTVEIVSLTFSLLIFLAFLRTAGYFRYIFPAQVVSIMFLPVSIYRITAFFQEKFSNWFPRSINIKLFWKIAMPLVIGALFVLSLYQLMFNSWAANYYESEKTAFWQEYFRKSLAEENLVKTGPTFFYDVPEVAMFSKGRNYYQYINLAPATGIVVGEENLDLIERGLPSKIFLKTAEFEFQKINITAAGYVPIETAYKYTILGKK